MRNLVLAALVIASASAFSESQTVNMFCGVNTYNMDGSDFKPLLGRDFDLALGKRSPLLNTANVFYSVIPKINTQGKEPRFSLFVEIQDAKTGTTISAAETEWTVGAPGAHQVSVYSSLAEPGIKTMLWCSFHK